MNATQHAEQNALRQDILLAEYTLGLLSGPDMARVHTLLSQDEKAVAAALAWEDRLLALTDLLPPVDPSPLLLQRIQTTLGHDTTPALSSLYRKPAQNASSTAGSGTSAQGARPPGSARQKIEPTLGPVRSPDISAAQAAGESGAAAAAPAAPASSTPQQTAAASAATRAAMDSGGWRSGGWRPGDRRSGEPSAAVSTAAASAAAAPAAAASAVGTPAASALPNAGPSSPGPSSPGSSSPEPSSPAPASAAAHGASLEAATETGKSGGGQALSGGGASNQAILAAERRADHRHAESSAGHPAARAGAASRGGNIWAWRIASVVFAVIALALALMPAKPAEPPVTIVQVAPTQAAILQAPGQSSTPGWVVTVDPQRNVLMQPRVRSDIAPDSSVQLWTHNKSLPQPRSLGLIDPNQPVTVPAALMGDLAPDQIFEMTLEPAGGSPNGSPTGPILFIGRTVTFGAPPAPTQAETQPQAEPRAGSGAQ